MIQAYTKTKTGLKPVPFVAGAPLPDDVVWIDLFTPSAEEEKTVGDALGLELPSWEERVEIEASSRLRREGETLYMTATLVSRAETERPEASPVTFVLSAGRLVTLRHADPRPFATFAASAEHSPKAAESGEAVLLGLLEAIIDRAADVLEHASADVDALSRRIFSPQEASGSLRGIMRRIGRSGDLTSRIQESLVSIDRMLIFLGQASPVGSREVRSRTKVMTRDIRSLRDHASFLAGKVGFLVDATLGLINVELNDIIKIFSVMAVVFLPPTLIASIYGMNFRHMPELEWLLGYPLSLGLMVASAVAPYLYFRRRGWL